MTGYVVRDRRATGRWALGLLVSVVVVTVVCAAAGRWWVAAVGLPLSLLTAGGRVRTETTPLRADARGVTLRGRWTGWGDVDEVAVTTAEPAHALVRVTLRSDAADRPVLAVTVPVDARSCALGIRDQAPTGVTVTPA